MDITIETPTKALIDNYTEQEYEDIKKLCAYEDGKAKQLFNRHKNNKWFKKKNPQGWEYRLQELQQDIKKNLTFIEGDNLYIRPGFVPYLKKFKPNISSKIQHTKLKNLSWKKEPDFEPYDYQKYSVEELLKIGHGHISLPTGAGKSHILLMLTKAIGDSVVVVTPSKSIFSELLRDFQERLGKHLVGGYGDGKKDITKPITIAIGRSITMLKKGTEAYDFFTSKKNLLVDESHTWASDNLDKTCHNILTNATRRIFVSATQTRGDGTVKLLNSIIGKKVYEMSIQEAMERKFLCPLEFRVLQTFSPSTKRTLDPLEAKREHFLYNKEIAQIASKIANASWSVNKESTLILVEELVQIQMLTKLLKVPYTYIHSASKKEAAESGLEKVKLLDELERFNRGEVRVLIGTKSISTGTNIYPTHNVVNWVGGSSEILTKQGTMGRSTRWMKPKYKKFHKEKVKSKIFDFDVQKNKILANMLKSRVRFYKETGEEIIYI